VFNIIILKLIIAILANTYNVFDNKSNGLYLSKILVTRDEMSFDECYGGFLTSMPLVNLLQLPFVPIVVFLPKHHPLVYYSNILLYKLQYFVFMSVFFVYFAVFSIVLIPVACFFAIMDKISTINQYESFQEQLFFNLLFYPFGLIILVLDTIADLYFFWVNNFRSTETLKQIIIPKEKSTLTFDSVKQVLTQFSRFQNLQIRTINTSILVKMFSNQMAVCRNIQFLLFGQMIPMGGFKSGSDVKQGMTFKTMKTQDLMEERTREIKEQDNTASL
jgi:hypothetical protein